MREILFRAKRKDDGKWVYGDLTHVVRITSNGDENCIRVGGYDIDESTIGQFTGMVDLNGQKIFEGDIFRYINLSYYMVVKWDQSQLRFGCSWITKNNDHPNLMYSFHYNENPHLYVMGNIYDDKTKD